MARRDGDLLMPSKSPAQAKLMAAAANNPKFAKDAGVPQDVAQEFHEADKAKHAKIARKLLGKGYE
jgi:hypothetical protein